MKAQLIAASTTTLKPAAVRTWVWTFDLPELFRLIAVTRKTVKIPPLSALTALLVASAHVLRTIGHQILFYNEESILWLCSARHTDCMC